MNICFICAEYPPTPHGGIGSVVQLLGQELTKLGHGVKVIGAYSNRILGNSPHYEEDCGVQVWRYPKSSARFGWMAARYNVYQQVSAWAKEGSIDLVETPDWEGWTACWPKLPVPVVTRLHGSVSYFAAEMDRRSRKTEFWMESASLRRADFWCSVSRYTADRTRKLFGLDHGPDRVIYNPVSVASTLPDLPRSPFDVIFSGTLTEKKGVVSLMEAWPRVIARNPKAKLHVYGKDTSNPNKPSMRDYLTNRLPENVRPTVEFHGHVLRANLLSHLRTARAAVFPSYAEAFAMAPLEAMAQGCATVSSIRGSGPELMSSGVDGILVDPDNHQQIADSLNRLLEDEALAARIGGAGMARVQQSFSISRIVGENEDFYSECLNRFRASARNN